MKDFKKWFEEKKQMLNPEEILTINSHIEKAEKAINSIDTIQGFFDKGKELHDSQNLIQKELEAHNVTQGTFFQQFKKIDDIADAVLNSAEVK